MSASGLKKAKRKKRHAMVSHKTVAILPTIVGLNYLNKKDVNNLERLKGTLTMTNQICISPKRRKDTKLWGR